MSTSTSKPDHISELLEGTTNEQVLQKGVQNSKSHHANNDNNYPHKLQSSSHNLDKHVCKTHNYSNQVNKVNGQA